MALAKKTAPRMDAQAFIAWRMSQPEPVRYELYDGQVHEMSAERLLHVRVKSRVHRQFERQIAERGLPCEAFADGVAVRIDEHTVFEPDTLVRCGPFLPDDLVLLLDPMIVVEVVSPSSQRIDALDKFARYFHNQNIIHYVIVMPEKGVVIHHMRASDGRIVGTSHSGDAVVRLDPPGLELSLAELFADARQAVPPAV
jgi:Uma2 family endonuclease